MFFALHSSLLRNFFSLREGSVETVLLAVIIVYAYIKLRSFRLESFQAPFNHLGVLVVSRD